MYVPEVKTDPDDRTVSMNDLVATSFNADYDGDEIMHTFSLDNSMEEMMYPYSPFFNLLLLDKPFSISRNASMSDPIIASISSWIEAEKREVA